MNNYICKKAQSLGEGDYRIAEFNINNIAGYEKDPKEIVKKKKGAKK